MVLIQYLFIDTITQLPMGAAIFWFMNMDPPCNLISREEKRNKKKENKRNKEKYKESNKCLQYTYIDVDISFLLVYIS